MEGVLVARPAGELPAMVVRHYGNRRKPIVQ